MVIHTRLLPTSPTTVTITVTISVALAVKSVAIKPVTVSFVVTIAISVKIPSTAAIHIYRWRRGYGSSPGIIPVAVTVTVHIATQIRSGFIDHYFITPVKIIAVEPVRQFITESPVTIVPVNELAVRNIIVGIDLREIIIITCIIAG
jgi:hypothetical protein